MPALREASQAIREHCYPSRAQVSGDMVTCPPLIVNVKQQFQESFFKISSLKFRNLSSMYIYIYIYTLSIIYIYSIYTDTYLDTHIYTYLEKHIPIIYNYILFYIDIQFSRLSGSQDLGQLDGTSCPGSTKPCGTQRWKRMGKIGWFNVVQYSKNGGLIWFLYGFLYGLYL